LPPEIPGEHPRTSAKLPPVPAQPMPAVYSAEQSRQFDASGIGHDALGIKNLFVVGRENLPGLGLEGELVAAWGLARLLTTARPKRDVLRRRILVGES
jgi:hypothetical protein